MNERFTGFVLSISDYRENDILMQVLSKEYGLLSLIGKGSRKVAGKNRFLPCCIYEFIFDYRPGKTIFTVHGSKLAHNYFEDKDIELMTLKNILCELALKNREIDSYDQLCFVFEHFEKEQAYLLSCMYLAYLTRKFGITPVVDGCVLCGSKKVVALSNRHGGFLCIDHLGSEQTVKVELLKKFRLVIKGDFVNYDVMKDFVYTAQDFKMLMGFYLENSDIRLKSYDFYLQVV